MKQLWPSWRGKEVKEITIVSLRRKFIFDIQVDPYWPKWETKPSKLIVKNFETSEFVQDTWDPYLMLWFVSAHMPWNAISNLELQQSYRALRSELLLPSATTLSNICWREYAQTLDAIKTPLPSQNEVSVAFDRWRSMNTLAITSVITYYMDRNWEWSEVQLASNEVVCLFFSAFERELLMIHQGPTHWSEASLIFEGRA